MPVTKLPDGKVTVKSDDGYSLEGLDPITATEELEKARGDRARVAADYKRQLDESNQRAAAFEQENVALKAQQEQAAVTPQVGGLTPEQIQWVDASEDLRARRRGFRNAQELWNFEANIAAESAESRKNRAVMDFQAKFPEYSNTVEASEILVNRVEKEFGLKPGGLDELCLANPQQATAAMTAGHLLLLREGASDYKIITEEERNAGWSEGLRQSNRPVPPPTLPSGSPETQAKETNPYAMTMDDLRKAALGQQR